MVDNESHGNTGSDPAQSSDPLEEFLEDFSGWELTELELEDMLAEARKTNNVKLRRLIKSFQYLRFLMPRLIELAEEADPANKILVLSKAALRQKEKSEDHERTKSVRAEEDTPR